MFLLITGRHVGVPPRYTNMAFLYKLFCKVARNVSANNAETVYHTDVRLEKLFMY